MRASIMPGHNAHNHLLSKGTRKSTMNLLSHRHHQHHDGDQTWGWTWIFQKRLNQCIKMYWSRIALNIVEIVSDDDVLGVKGQGESWKWCVARRAIVILHRHQSKSSPNLGNTFQLTHRESIDHHKKTRTMQNWIWTETKIYNIFPCIHKHQHPISKTLPYNAIKWK